MKDKELEEMIARVDAEIEREGGSTGSNMREPPYIPPGPVEIPKNLPKAEYERRKRNHDELVKILHPTE